MTMPRTRKIPSPPSFPSPAGHRAVWTGARTSGLTLGQLSPALKHPAGSDTVAVLICSHLRRWLAGSCWLEGIHLPGRPEAGSLPCPCPHCSLSPPPWKSLSVPQARTQLCAAFYCLQTILCVFADPPHVDGARLEAREPIFPQGSAEGAGVGGFESHSTTYTQKSRCVVPASRAAVRTG